MSSAGFETELAPRRPLRRFVVALSAGATLAGAFLILDLPLLPGPKAAFAALWLCAGLLEFRAQCRGMCRISRIRVDSEGRLRGQTPEGEVEPLQLLTGSVVLRRVAWLRLRFADGAEYGELLTGNARLDEQWRRLQLIWRQRASVFGGPRGS
ncbi:MAG: hypothetical protein WD795_01455 [Woeseia sp.]